MQKRAALTLILSVLLTASVAGAQEAPETPADGPGIASGPSIGGRFRFGIDGVGGLESVGSNGVSVSGPMFGADVRLGWQLNDLFAIYAEPHLSFGSLSTSVAGSTVSGGTGTFVGTLMGEATFQDTFFAGAGFGYGVLNNPSGFAVEARGGFYPLMWRGEDGVRRKGLMVGADFRSIFASGATGILVLATVGYEVF